MPVGKAFLFVGGPLDGQQIITDGSKHYYTQYPLMESMKTLASPQSYSQKIEVKTVKYHLVQMEHSEGTALEVYYIHPTVENLLEMLVLGYCRKCKCN